MQERAMETTCEEANDRACTCSAGCVHRWKRSDRWKMCRTTACMLQERAWEGCDGIVTAVRSAGGAVSGAN